jgi:hypothetical protein
MGTRSVTYFYNSSKTETPICAVYRQFDGYPDGHGKDLLDIISKYKIINGFTSDQEDDHKDGIQLYANGADDLIVQVIMQLKQMEHHQLGGLYMYSPNADGDLSFIDYVYHVYCIDDVPHIIGYGYNNKLVFDTQLEDPYIKEDEDDEDE